MLKIKESKFANENYKFIILFWSLWCVFAIVPEKAAAQTTEFSYQGRLADNGGQPLTGAYDFEFRLYDANNNLLGTQTRLGVAVSNGSFTVSLNYGSNPNLFTGAPRLLEISVRQAGNGLYTTLNPRQPITSAPYSIRSREAATADAATNSTQLGGVDAVRFIQSDASGNVNIGGNLNVGGTFTQPIVNADTEYRIGNQRVLSVPGNNFFAGLSAGAANNTGFRNSFAGTESGLSNTTGA
ncbi:MAG TPA: hypothetical protein VK308_15250, partial [Pyrinomonadaceae bacterium]|nr:hypothetical protein [Pyrinomonadaceae bacterium]